MFSPWCSSSSSTNSIPSRDKPVAALAMQASNPKHTSKWFSYAVLICIRKCMMCVCVQIFVSVQGCMHAYMHACMNQVCIRTHNHLKKRNENQRNQFAFMKPVWCYKHIPKMILKSWNKTYASLHRYCSILSQQTRAHRMVEKKHGIRRRILETPCWPRKIPRDWIPRMEQAQSNWSLAPVTRKHLSHLEPRQGHRRGPWLW